MYIHNMYLHNLHYADNVTCCPPQVIAKINHFDPSALHKLCWECFSTSHDPQLVRVISMVSQQSATLLWLLFCKLDIEGKLKLHPEVCVLMPLVTMTGLKIYICMYIHVYIWHICVSKEETV